MTNCFHSLPFGNLFFLEINSEIEFSLHHAELKTLPTGSAVTTGILLKPSNRILEALVHELLHLELSYQGNPLLLEFVGEWLGLTPERIAALAADGVMMRG